MAAQREAESTRNSGGGTRSSWSGEVSEEANMRGRRGGALTEIQGGAERQGEQGCRARADSRKMARRSDCEMRRASS
eukprot:6200213-Pleurochrysis_carterae.AAC.1